MNERKMKIYDQTKLYFQEKYKIKQIDTFGLLISPKATLSTF